MFISLKAHNGIVNRLEQDLEEARNLKYLLQEIVNRTGIPLPPTSGGELVLNSEGGWGSVEFPDNIAIYVDDYFGGKVVKQEATKVVVLNEDGEASYHLTIKPPSEGRKYLLVQE